MVMNLQIAAVPVRRKQTVKEEIFNSVLHYAGAFAALCGAAYLILRNRGVFGNEPGSIKSLGAYSIYGASMIILFLSSAFYHGARKENVKRILQMCDHSGIYILIAGTYTPVCLLLIPGAAGWALVISEWALAAIGITLHLLNIKNVKKAEVFIWLIMGWAIVFMAPVLIHSARLFTLAMLLGGGITYSLGVFFYKKPQRRFFHVIWHIFVLAGAALQWISVYTIA
jgi:hemolysin III